MSNYRVTLQQPLQPDKRSPALQGDQELVDFLAALVLKPGLHPLRKMVITNDTLTAIVVERIDEVLS